MNNLNYEIKELKNEVINADLTGKLNALRNLVADEKEHLEDYKDMLEARNDVVGAYATKEHLNNSYVVLSVINAIAQDVELMNKEVMAHFNNAIEEIKKASSENFGEGSDNA